MQRPDFKDWWEEIALPLYKALDTIGDEIAAAEGAYDPWPRLIELVPWLASPEAAKAAAAAFVDADTGWNEIKSSNIKRWRVVEHDDTSDLWIEFHTGAVWRYINVPGKVIAAFIVAESPGRFFGDNIRGRYSDEKMGEAASPESDAPAK